MRYLITTALLTTALALPFAGNAGAQSFSGDIIAQCTRAVGQMKFEGWPADRNRDMMMLSCESNGGIIPGAQQESPAALRNAPRQR